MKTLKFNKELYSKIALIKAAYNYTDSSYIHLETDDRFYYVMIESKNGNADITEKEFTNEMLAQSVRHEVYKQTKSIRELLLARAMATSIIVDNGISEERSTEETFDENEILKDWFAQNEED